MKKIILFLVVFFTISCNASDILGFRGIFWGDNPTKLGEYIVFKEHPIDNSIVYKRKIDELKIGDAKLNAIFYEFFADKLQTVVIKFERHENLVAIQQAFESQYGGRFIQPDKYMEQYFLDDGGPAKIIIMCFPGDTNCYAFIANIKITEEAKAYKESVAKKDAKDLLNLK